MIVHHWVMVANVVSTKYKFVNLLVWECLRTPHRRSKVPNFSGGACPQTPLGDCGHSSQISNLCGSGKLALWMARPLKVCLLQACYMWCVQCTTNRITGYRGHCDMANVHANEHLSKFHCFVILYSLWIDYTWGSCLKACFPVHPHSMSCKSLL